MCDEDHVALWPGTVSTVWKIEGLLAPRPGGATCAAYHLHSGARVAIDLVRGGATPMAAPAAARVPDATALKILTQELQALRLLEHPNTLRLVEEGTDRSDSEGDIQYLVTDLGPARPLPDVLEDWERAGLTGSGPQGSPVPMALAALSQLGRQLLSVLSAAHRLGLAHGSLSVAHIYVTCEEDSVQSLGRTGAVRLHGLRALGLGQTLREAIAADLIATGAILYELCAGKAPPSPEASKAGEVASLPAETDVKLAQVILRGIGANPGLRYGSADEMLRALIVAAPPVISEVSASALAALTRTDPQAGRPAASEPIISTPAPLPRVTAPQAVLPAPPSPLGTSPGADMPMRSRLSGELRQVSFRDLVEQKADREGEETLARSRRRVSASSMKVLALPPPSEIPEFIPAGASGRARHDNPALSSGEHASLEPTADLNALPVDFASSISGRVGSDSSLREGRSEISLPPQPALPEPGPKGLTKSDPKFYPKPEPKSEPRSETKPEPAAKPGNRPRAEVDPEIDPLAVTGQSRIPQDVLAAARRFQPQMSAALPRPQPVLRTPFPEPSSSTPGSPPPPAISSSGAPLPSFAPLAPSTPAPSVQRAGSRPLWPWIAIGTAVLLGLLWLLLGR
jgi:serine/threonine protein kinase